MHNRKQSFPIQGLSVVNAVRWPDENGLHSQNLFTDLPVLAFLAGDNKIRMAQQHLLMHDIRYGYPAQRYARCAGMRADKELFESHALSRSVHPEALADVGAVLIVIGDFQPFAFSSAPGCSAMPEQRSTGHPLTSARPSACHQGRPEPCHIRGSGGRRYHFQRCTGAVLKRKRKSHCSRCPSSSSNQP